MNQQPMPNNDENMWGMLCHLSAFAGYLIPFRNIIGPLVIWLIKKDEYPLVDDQGKESLNFQISIAIYAIISLILAVLIIGFFLLIALGILNLVMIIVASVKANEGVRFRYPFVIKFFQ